MSGATFDIEARRPVLSGDGRPVEELVVNIGPSHPSTHGVFRAVVHLDGEIVTKVVPHIGYLHRGIEKMAENRTYLQIVPLTDRLDYVGSMYANWAYCRALERLAGIRVPERAEYLRVIVCELQRIASHMMGVGASGADTGATTAFMYAFDQRERVVDLFEKLCGARLTYNYVRPGGVSFDAPEGWFDEVRAFCAQHPAAMMSLDTLFFGNAIARARMKGIGALSEQDAIDWGVSGPTARASGVVWDMRRHDPYSVYPRFDFEIPVGERGDVYDRGRVKVFECIESCKIIVQALDQIEGGAVHAAGLPRLITPPEGDAYDHIESARGSLGVYLVSDGGPRPLRMHVRSPAFCNLAVVEQLALGHTLSDLVVIIGSLDPVFGEVDR
jgi:NADH-quinone oxidoreductase subunit D